VLTVARIACFVLALAIVLLVPLDLWWFFDRRPWTFIAVEVTAAAMAVISLSRMAIEGRRPAPWPRDIRRGAARVVLISLLAAAGLDLWAGDAPSTSPHGHWPWLSALAIVVALRSLR
jgi:hypothetical protein